MLGFEEHVLKSLEIFIIPDQIEIGLQWLLLHDAVQVLVQALEVADKAVNEVLDSMFRLIDPINFFFRVVLLVRFGLVRVGNGLQPNVDNGNCESNWEVEHEDRCLELNHTKLLKVKEEYIGSFLLFLRSLFLLFC